MSDKIGNQNKEAFFLGDWVLQVASLTSTLALL